MHNRVGKIKWLWYLTTEQGKTWTGSIKLTHLESYSRRILKVDFLIKIGNFQDALSFYLAIFTTNLK